MKEAGERGNWGIEWMNANPTEELSMLASDNICLSCEHSDGDGQVRGELEVTISNQQTSGISQKEAGPEIQVMGNHIMITTKQTGPSWEEGTLKVLAVNGAEILATRLHQGLNEFEIHCLTLLKGTGLCAADLVGHDIIDCFEEIPEINRIGYSLPVI